MADVLNEEGNKAEACEIIRTLIEKVVLTPDAEESDLRAELHGDIAAILAFCEIGAPKKQLPHTGVQGSQLSVVAGARNQRCLHLDYATL